MVKWILTVSISLLDGHMAIVYYIIDKKKKILIQSYIVKYFLKIKKCSYKIYWSALFTDHAERDKFVSCAYLKLN